MVTASKQSEFHSKNKFEKLVRLVSYVVRIYHDARSSKVKFIPKYVQVVHIINNT